MEKTIIFIHGMFQNAKSWENWSAFFEGKGYTCIAKSWPYHEGDPAHLREHIPQDLGELHLNTVIDEFTGIVSRYTQPILIGHSVGGLIAQALVNKGLGSAAVCIDSVAPNRMLALNWGFFKNSLTIANPFAGDEPFLMTAEGFHENFANGMTREASDKEYNKTATHDSRNMLRDCMMEDGHVNLDKPHVPLLFIAGEIDQIIPPELNKKNCDAYTDKNSICDFKEFTHRGHYICGEPGWEEVAEYSHEWLEKTVISKMNESVL